MVNPVIVAELSDAEAGDEVTSVPDDAFTIETVYPVTALPPSSITSASTAEPAVAVT